MSVGVFQGHAVDEILAVVDGLGLDAAQLHGNSTGSLETVAARVATTITAVQVDGADLPAFEHESVDIVMLDAAEPGRTVDDIGTVSEQPLHILDKCRRSYQIVWMVLYCHRIHPGL